MRVRAFVCVRMCVRERKVISAISIIAMLPSRNLCVKPRQQTPDARLTGKRISGHEKDCAEVRCHIRQGDPARDVTDPCTHHIGSQDPACTHAPPGLHCLAPLLPYLRYGRFNGAAPLLLRCCGRLEPFLLLCVPFSSVFTLHAFIPSSLQPDSAHFSPNVFYCHAPH